MGSVSDLRKGRIIKYDGSIYEISESQHVNPGKGQAFVRATLKNVETGSTVKETLKKGASFDVIRLEERDVQFLYEKNNNYYFMDLDSYEQYIIDEDKIRDEIKFLKEGMECNVEIAEGNTIGVSLPKFVTLEVISTTPGVRGNTAQGGTKPAELETGTTVKVPLFIEEGDRIVVDTRTGEYSERK